jgi:hypothetical protein
MYSLNLVLGVDEQDILRREVTMPGSTGPSLAPSSDMTGNGTPLE